MRKLGAFGSLLLVIGCSFPRSLVARHHHHRDGGPPETAATPSPARATFVKMISWAEPSTDPCSTDLEGSAPPASFTLRYGEAGGATVAIENDPEKLFGAGWGVITRSARGMGFEKGGEFTALDFDIVEELQCRCESATANTPWKGNALVHVKLEWKPGARPSVTASLRDGDRFEDVPPVAINGRLPMYEFRFAKPFPEASAGECASRFLVALALDQPIE